VSEFIRLSGAGLTRGREQSATKSADAAPIAYFNPFACSQRTGDSEVAVLSAGPVEQLSSWLTGERPLGRPSPYPLDGPAELQTITSANDKRSLIIPSDGASQKHCGHLGSRLQPLRLTGRAGRPLFCALCAAFHLSPAAAAAAAAASGQPIESEGSARVQFGFGDFPPRLVAFRMGVGRVDRPPFGWGDCCVCFYAISWLSYWICLRASCLSSRQLIVPAAGSVWKWPLERGEVSAYCAQNGARAPR